MSSYNTDSYRFGSYTTKFLLNKQNIANRVKEQEKPKTEQDVWGTLGQHPYDRAHNSPYRTQIYMKLILDETRLQDQYKNINYTIIGFKMN